MAKKQGPKYTDFNESILVDSLGGLVEQHLTENDDQWQLFQSEFSSKEEKVLPTTKVGGSNS